jgi:hypothetical protein
MMGAPSSSPRRQGWLAVAGILLVAVATGLGIGYGQREAQQMSGMQDPKAQGKPARQDISTAAATATGKVSNASAVDAGEVILTNPRYAKPPELFDPISAMAAARAASAPASGPAPTTTRASAPTSKPAVPAIAPVGWAGTGSALQQMWESNARTEWKVRPAPLTAPNWRISGVVQRGQQTQVIVQFDGETVPRFFKLGDVLPGGAKLAWVKPNVIGVVLVQNDALALPVLDGQTQSSLPASATPSNPAASTKP